MKRGFRPSRVAILFVVTVAAMVVCVFVPLGSDRVPGAVVFQKTLPDGRLLVVGCRPVPYVPMSPAEKARLEPTPMQIIKPDRLFRYALRLVPNGGEATEEIWWRTAPDFGNRFPDVDNRVRVFDVAVFRGAAVILYWMNLMTCAEVVPLDGSYRGPPQPFGWACLVRDWTSDGEVAVGGRIEGSLDDGDLNLVVVNNRGPGERFRPVKDAQGYRWERVKAWRVPASGPATRPHQGNARRGG